MTILKILSFIEITAGILFLFLIRNWERSWWEGAIRGMAMGTLAGGMFTLFLIISGIIL